MPVFTRRACAARRAFVRLLPALPAGLLGAGLARAGSAAEAPPASRPASPAEPSTYTVAVVPQFATVRVYEDWHPLLQALQQATGMRLVLKTYANIPAFEAAYLRGEPDFAFMNPYDVVVAHRAQGYRPLVRDAHPLQGILVVRADSPIHELAALDHARLAFPAPNAFGASLYMRALLAQQGLHIQPEYLGTHQNVYRAVARGDVVAGGAVRETLLREPQALQQRLRVIYSTPRTAPHALVVDPRVPAARALQLQHALLDLAARPAGAGLLRRIQMPQPVQASYRRDYAPLESLHLDRFYVAPASTLPAS